MVLSLDVVPTGDIPTGASMLVGLLVCIVLMVVFGSIALLFHRPDKAREEPRMKERFSFPSFNEELAAASIRIREERERASVQQPSTAESQARKAEQRRDDRKRREAYVLASVRHHLDRVLPDTPTRAHVLYEWYSRVGGIGTLGEFERALEVCRSEGRVCMLRAQARNARPGARRIKLYRKTTAQTAVRSYPTE